MWTACVQYFALISLSRIVSRRMERNKKCSIIVSRARKAPILNGCTCTHKYEYNVFHICGAWLPEKVYESIIFVLLIIGMGSQYFTDGGNSYIVSNNCNLPFSSSLTNSCHYFCTATTTYLTQCSKCDSERTFLSFLSLPRRNMQFYVSVV